MEISNKSKSISLFDTMGKVYERIICNCVDYEFDNNDGQFEHQIGFRKKRIHRRCYLQPPQLWKGNALKVGIRNIT